MLVTYDPFVDRMIQKYEGGYGWDKNDSGGPTKYGITCFDLADERHQKMTSMAAWAPLVQAMPLSEAETIYHTKYAAAINYDALPAGVDCCMMDYAVNSGIARAIRVARAMTKVNGSSARVDDDLLAAIRKYDASQFIQAMCDERLQFMHAIRGGSAWAQFGRGWGARVADLREYSEHLAAGKTSAPPPAPDLSNVSTPKAQHAPATAGTATTGGAVATGGAMIAAGFHWYYAVGGVLAVMVGGVVYEVYEEQKAATANAKVVLPTTVVAGVTNVAAH